MLVIVTLISQILEQRQVTLKTVGQIHPQPFAFQILDVLDVTSIFERNDQGSDSMIGIRLQWRLSDASVNFHFDATRSFHLKIGKIK